MEPLVIPPAGVPLERGALATLRRARAVRLAKELSSRARSPGAAHVFRSLEALARSAPATFVEIVSDPSVGVFLETDDTASAISVLAFSLACAGELDGSIELAPSRLCSLSHRLLLEPYGDVASILLHSGSAFLRARGRGGLELRLDVPELGEHAMARLSSPFHTIQGSLALGLFDPNPLNLVEAHPEKRGNPLSLGEHPLAVWLDTLGNALVSLERTMPELCDEMRLLMRFVYPAGSFEEKQQSASYREYIGALYLTLHPQVLSVLEALVHEFQHNKLNLCAERYPLLENAYAPLYPSPIRPDPRPLMGVLLAAHAFVPVAELYRRLREEAPGNDALARRLADVVAANHEALATLGEHGRFTSAGARIFEELSAWHARHLALGLPLEKNIAHVA